MQVDRCEIPLVSRAADDGIRHVLAISTIVLIALAMLMYALVRDIGVLASTTVIGFAAHAVFRYYFALGAAGNTKGGGRAGL